MNRKNAAQERSAPNRLNAKREAYLAVLYSFFEIEVKVMRLFWADFFGTIFWSSGALGAESSKKQRARTAL